MYKVIFIVLTYMILIIGYTVSDLTENAYCYGNKSYINHEGKKSYYNKIVCCQNYENVTGKCKPCEVGFSSKNESSCKPCSTNLYGRRCSMQCNCNENLRCDHIIGCVEKINSTTHKEDGCTETGIYASSTNHVDCTTQTNEGYVSEIAIYIACTCAISVGISCFLIWKKYMRRQQNRIELVRRRGNSDSEIANTLQHASVAIRSEENEPVYDEVDETMLNSTSPIPYVQNDNHDCVIETPQSTELKQHEVNNARAEKGPSTTSINQEVTCTIEINTEYSEPLPLTCQQEDSYMEVEE